MADEIYSVPARNTLILMSLSFGVGIYVGYKLKELRVKYLQAKKDRLRRRYVKACEELESSTSVEFSYMPAIGGERIPATVDNNAELSKPTGSRGESGALVRKSSIRRRLSSSENKESYGNLAEEYNKLAEKILQDPSVTKSIEALQERWKMLMFMYDDAMDLIQSRKERQLMIKWCHKRRELFAAGVVYSAISFLAFILLLVFIYIAVLLI